jgi:hypothetical protein
LRNRKMNEHSSTFASAARAFEIISVVMTSKRSLDSEGFAMPTMPAKKMRAQQSNDSNRNTSGDADDIAQLVDRFVCISSLMCVTETIRFLQLVGHRD